ncbi:MAG: response regulator [Verrucomicrobiales bacterium]|nr:response regulator [Verrucomicrobiales bacterium]
MNLSKTEAEPEEMSVHKSMILNSVIVGSVLLPVIAATFLLVKLHGIHDIVAEKSRAGTAMICLLSLDALISEDRPVLETVVSGLESLETGLVSVELLNQQGEVLASWKRENSDSLKTVKTVQPVKYLGLEFGKAKMSWSYEHFAGPVVRNVIENCLMIFGAGLILMFFMILFVQKTFVKPIEYLDHKVQSIAIHSTPEKPEFRIRTREFRNLNNSLDTTAKILAEKAADESRIIRATEQARSARESAKAKMDFLSLMSHEIRTPLGVIIGFSKLLAEADLDNEDLGYVHNINQSGEFLLQIVNDILDLSKIEADGLQLDPGPMSIPNLCEAMGNLMSPVFLERGVKFKTNYDEVKDAWVVGDQHRLKQILMNLIGNASKFTEKGSVTLEAREIENCVAGTNRIRFSVIDTGVGMSEEIVSKIFKPFSQADNSISRKHGGTGLGLSISNQLVKLMGGNFDVESETGKGSVFSFEIDMEIVPACEIPADESGDVMSLGSGRSESEGQRILVVEDEKMNRLLIGKVFRKIGFDVEFAEDGQICVDLLSAGENYDVIFLDLHLPKIGGMEIAEQIRDGKFGEKTAGVKIAIMSADVFGAEQSEKLGVDAVISKPVDFNDLRNFLETVNKPAARVKPKQKKENKLARSKPSRLNVLVVEDQEINQHLIGKIFDLFGIRPAYAGDGLQCLEYLARDSTFDAILLDLRMPRMDGLTVAQKIRNGDAGARYKEIPIAVISAEILAKDDCHLMGIEDFIPKPLDIELLRGFVEKVESEVALAG